MDQSEPNFPKLNSISSQILVFWFNAYYKSQKLEL